MTYVIKEKDKYLCFETFVRDLDVLVQVDPTSYINVATTFFDVDDARDFVNFAKASGYDTTDYQLVDKDKAVEEEKNAKENAKYAKLKATWDSFNEEGKRAFLSSIKEEDRKEFLEKTLGIEFTEEQKQILRTKEDF